ncbi:SRPBCC family protein [Allokutzneria oryzae]|uniref:SRPBCC family protein n=1 Tax=Allokutzneria oryzae TaxID=1378989 RepID=A0ABV6A8Q6_9PSEU
MIKHATFTLERDYSAPPAKVFALWADPASKARWFAGPGSEHELDFREGGAETARGVRDGVELSFETVYREIVTGSRIVYSSVLRAGKTVATASLTSVQFEPTERGARLVLTEQGAYLDGHEEPEWRRQGTESQLVALEACLSAP